MEDECCEVYEAGLTTETVFDGISQFYPRGMPKHIAGYLRERMASRPAPLGYAHVSFYVPTYINQTLSTMGPKWFDARRPMPDFDTQVMKLVIGRDGVNFKCYQAEHGALFLWFDRYTQMMHMWGYPPHRESDFNIIDLQYNISVAISDQTKLRHRAALERLHRATTRRRREQGHYLRVEFE